MKTFALCASAALLLSAAAAGAAPLSPVSYSMINGEGTAGGGGLNYWDRAYSGTGAVSGAGPMDTDLELLTGGTGDLTDGYIETQHWNLVENISGTGPYVGWNNESHTITFDFGVDVLVTSMTLYYDSGATGGVHAPDSFSFGAAGGPYVSSGVLADVTGPTSTTLLSGAAGTLFELNLFTNGAWTFVSEVTFEGEVIGGAGAEVPVPAAAPLLLAGLAGFGLLRRRG